MKRLRKLVRRTVLDACSATARLTGKFNQPADDINVVQVALLHRIQPQEEQQFDEFVAWLVNNFNTVSYRKAIGIIQSRENCGPTMAVSFDDGFKDNLRAAEILHRHGVSACFFVCPSMVGETNEAAIRKFSFENLQKKDVRRFMNWDDLERLKSLGHEVGNHTMDHVYLMDQTDDQFIEQVGTAKEILDAKLGDTLHFSWPFGRYSHFKPQWVEVVLEMGHLSCASGERGGHRPQDDHEGPYANAIKRNTVDMEWPLSHSQYFLTRELW